MLQILTYARHSCPLSSESSLECNTFCDTGHLLECQTYCDTGHLFIMGRRYMAEILSIRRKTLSNQSKLYNGYLRGPVTLAPIAERLAVKLSLPDFTTKVCQGFEQPTFPLRHRRVLVFS